MKNSIPVVTTLAAMAALIAHASAQQVKTREEVGENGTRYLVTEQTVQQTESYIDYETHTQKVYQPQYSTEMKSFQHTYAVPVTEHRMVSRLKGWWNPFQKPYWTHNVEPQTRWHYHPATVQIPMTKTSWVEATQTVQLPITKYRTKDILITRREPIAPGTSGPGIRSLGPTQTAPMVASRPASGRYGSQRITSDPPRRPTTLR